MPSVINRYQPNQNLKLEKECEKNDVMRKKIRSANRNRIRAQAAHHCQLHQSFGCQMPSEENVQHFEKLFTPKTETVWDRLSKVKKAISQGDSLCICNKSPCNLTTDAPTVLKKSIGTQYPTKHNTNELPLPKKNQPVQPMEDDLIKDICEHDDKQFREIFKVRSNLNSESSIDDSITGSRNLFDERSSLNDMYFTPGSVLDFTDLEVGPRNFRFAPNDLENFDVATLIDGPKRDSVQSFSSRISNTFCEMFSQRRQTLEPDDMKMIKNVVKTDDRYRCLKKNDSGLLKDILKTQLQQILHQESVVKAALDKLRTPRHYDVKKIDKYILENSTEYVDLEQEDQKPQVDIIFKNVPTLEKEILILRALGEKLEDTLRRSSTIREPPFIERRSAATSTSSIENFLSVQTSLPLRPRIFQTLKYIGFIKVESNSTILCIVQGIRTVKGYAQEYRIALKTIVELKEEGNKHFYLPASDDNTELKRTCFKKLKSNPDVLMHYLKPKNANVPFNYLEQDAIFFKNMLLNKSSKCDKSAKMVFPEVTKEEEPSDESEASISTDTRCKMMPQINEIMEKIRKENEVSELNRLQELIALRDAYSLPYEFLEASTRDLKHKFGGFRHIKSTSSPVMNSSMENIFVEQHTAKMFENEVTAPKRKSKKHKSVKLVEEKNCAKCGKCGKCGKGKKQLVDKQKVYRSNIKKREPSSKPVQKPKISLPEPILRKRRRLNGSVTPLNDKNYVDPKNNLIKTVVVGAAQISVFILLIMAMTFNIKC